MYGCDITIKENDTFALSTFPSQYVNKLCVFADCSKKNYKVKITFLYLDIQDTDCSTDKIEVYNGKYLAQNYKLADICNGG